MQISSSLQVSPRTQAIKRDTQTAETKEQESIRPQSDKWVVGGKSFDDTAQLLASYKSPLGGEKATYIYTHEAPQHLANRLGTSLGAAGGGAAMGAGLGILMSGFGSVVSAIAGGSGPGIGSILIPAAIGAIGGAFVGYSESSADKSQLVEGRLLNQQTESGENKLYFSPELRSGPVDLEAYSQAGEASVHEPGDPWDEAVSGAGVGSALGLAVGAGLGMLTGDASALATLTLGGAAFGAALGGLNGPGATQREAMAQEVAPQWWNISTPTAQERQANR